MATFICTRIQKSSELIIVGTGLSFTRLCQFIQNTCRFTYSIGGQNALNRITHSPTGDVYNHIVTPI